MLQVLHNKEGKGFVKCPKCGKHVWVYVPTNRMVPNDIRIRPHPKCDAGDLSILDYREEIKD